MIWDAETGEALSTLSGHTDQVNSVAWHPDGRRLASGSADDTIRLIPEVYTQPPCQWLIYNLSLDGWRRYRGYAIYRPTCDNLPSPEMPGLMESIPEDPELLLLTVRGRFVLGSMLAVFLGLVGVTAWGAFRLVSWMIRRIARARGAT
jgi:hypothetical protein